MIQMQIRGQMYQLQNPGLKLNRRAHLRRRPLGSAPKQAVSVRSKHDGGGVGYNSH